MAYYISNTIMFFTVNFNGIVFNEFINVSVSLRVSCFDKTVILNHRKNQKGLLFLLCITDYHFYKSCLGLRMLILSLEYRLKTSLFLLLIVP